MPESRAWRITSFHDSGRRPPDGAVPKTNTSAPRAIASLSVPTIGKLVSNFQNSFRLLPAALLSMTATHSFGPYLKIPSAILVLG